MINSLFSSLSGLNAASRKLQASANNLANVQTPGFKSSHVTLADNASGGVRVSGVARTSLQGPLVPTNNPLDVAVQGNGFLQVALSGGGTGFTRLGALKIDGSGRLVTADGNPLIPEITIPGNAQVVSIGSDGSVSALVNGQTQTLGQLQLAGFQNPAGLNSIGNGLFTVSGSSGQPIIGSPGTNSLGTLQSGSLELSNVDITEEIVQQILASNQFRANASAIRAADDMAGTLLDITA
ncbi:flagellar hook-basal body protein [Nitrospina gracilis]|uniref:flagellar hook-basal body protein n=1 Tax=Nitrospina gracilis TaxID=35801 RepID=UPI001F3CA90A|nr:flagellar hook-basal body complex protein [Nitrospina gracilis]MCF8719178.1 flagellar basal-body rod protein FlgG [Nitrospina gracilis Nb-211]